MEGHMSSGGRTIRYPTLAATAVAAAPRNARRAMTFGRLGGAPATARAATLRAAGPRVLHSRFASAKAAACAGLSPHQRLSASASAAVVSPDDRRVSHS